MNDISIDLETLGTSSDATVISIGAQQFDPATGALGASFYVAIDIAAAVALNPGGVSGSTIKWWMQQSDAARQAAFSGTDSPHSAATKFRLWVANLPDFPRVWGNGATFDITILENFLRRTVPKSRRHEAELPWSFRDVRDMRTLVALYPQVFEKVPREGTHHNALDDARHQAKIISAAWRKLA